MRGLFRSELGHKDWSDWSSIEQSKGYKLTGWALTLLSWWGLATGATMISLFFLFLLALSLSPSSATGVISWFFPNMNFKVFSHQGQLKDALDHLLIKSLWMIRKVICSVNMYIVHLVVCTFCVFHYIQQCFGGTVYNIHNNQTTLLR